MQPAPPITPEGEGEGPGEGGRAGRSAWGVLEKKRAARTKKAAQGQGKRDLLGRWEGGTRPQGKGREGGKGLEVEKVDLAPAQACKERGQAVVCHKVQREEAKARRRRPEADIRIKSPEDRIQRPRGRPGREPSEAALNVRPYRALESLLQKFRRQGGQGRQEPRQEVAASGFGESVGGCKVVFQKAQKIELSGMIFEAQGTKEFLLLWSFGRKKAQGRELKKKARRFRRWRRGQGIGRDDIASVIEPERDRRRFVGRERTQGAEILQKEPLKRLKSVQPQRWDRQGLIVGRLQGTGERKRPDPRDREER